MLSSVIADDRADAEAEVQAKLPILKEIVTRFIPSANIEVDGSDLVVKDKIRIIEGSLPNSNTNGAPIHTTQMIPLADGVMLIFRSSPNPYYGSADIASWPNLSGRLSLNSEGHYQTFALISVPEEKVSVFVHLEFGDKVSKTLLDDLYKALFEEMGSFKNGRTFFKTMTVARSVLVAEGLRLIPKNDPRVNFNAGYILRKGEPIGRAE